MITRVCFQPGAGCTGGWLHMGQCWGNVRIIINIILINALLYHADYQIYLKSNKLNTCASSGIV